MDTIPIEAPFAASFPLPFRVLVLAGMAILCWATNLHGLHILGVDAASVLEFRSHSEGNYVPLRLTTSSPPDAILLARAVYRLCTSYAFVVFAGWAFFRVATRGDLALVDVHKWIPAVTMLVVVMLVVSPFNILERRVRDMFLFAVRRCLFSTSSKPVYFCDNVLADISTSLAKVIGDVWLSLCMFMPGGSLLVFPQQEGWTKFMVPFLLSVPYGVRFRQCINDYMQPATTDRKQLYNALKYATSFPVIFLSSAQRQFASESSEAETDTKEHPLFRLWLLFVVVNSLCSFWWDVTNDWGLELLTPNRDYPRQALKPLLLPALPARRPSLENSPTLRTHASSVPNESTDILSSQSCPSNSLYGQRSDNWGLRPILLFPLPAYPMAIFVNLVLRLTWSLKLSEHLHAQVGGALLFFWLELAELLRRWLWVFFRVEWECVRREMERERGESVAMQLRRAAEEGEENEYDDGRAGMSANMEMSNVGNVLFDEAQDKLRYDDGIP